MQRHGEFANRLKKRERALHAWKSRERLEAYRVYQRDLPNYPYYVDRYGEHVVVYENSPPDKPVPPAEEIRDCVADALRVSPEHIHYKTRRQMKGTQQYERLGERAVSLWVREYRAEYRTNLSDYLDTGLFLDHRPTRKRFQGEDRGRFLNLFCYTGAVSVAAALGGARCLSVDLSNTYLEWGRQNFERNRLKGDFLRADAIEYVRQAPRGHFDSVFLDPPSFSNSKRMASTFDVQRDHAELLRSVMPLLKDDGLLLFSNNRRGFRMDPALEVQYQVEDTTEKTVPWDFNQSRPHRSFEIRPRKKRLPRGSSG